MKGSGNVNNIFILLKIVILFAILVHILVKDKKLMISFVYKNPMFLKKKKPLAKCLYIRVDDVRQFIKQMFFSPAGPFPKLIYFPSLKRFFL